MDNTFKSYYDVGYKKKQKMEINKASWLALKDQIESLIDNNPEISDISINYQIKEMEHKNYLKLNIKNL